MKRYMTVRGSEIYDFPTMLFVQSDDEISVYSESKSAKMSYERYIDRKKVKSLTVLAHAFPYCDVDIDQIDDSNKTTVERLIAELSNDES